MDDTGNLRIDSISSHYRASIADSDTNTDADTDTLNIVLYKIYGNTIFLLVKCVIKHSTDTFDK